MKLKYITPALLLSCAIAQAQEAPQARTLSFELTNLTQGIVFTPLLIAAHGPATDLFEIGKPASPSLQALAEGGAIAPLAEEFTTVGAAVIENPAAGPLMPVNSTVVAGFDAQGHQYLSLAAMLLPTNDGFVGLDAWPIPSEPGTYTLMLNAYDAGTEANDERVVDGGGMPGTAGIPAVPLFSSGTGGAGITTTITNETVHIHPGNIGDSDLQGGASDLVNHQHRWLNPVAKLVITVE